MRKVQNNDQQAERKQDHITMAVESRTKAIEQDKRFYYEPLFVTHPNHTHDISRYFLGKELKAPIWVSSMTGGTGPARHINQNLARACGEFGLGMGLGSCRVLLDSDEYLKDFQLRPLMKDQPLYANLGIAQINHLIQTKQLSKITELLNKLEADGLIIHVNPIQEWLQPEGDPIENYTPHDAIKIVLDELGIMVIVKEVGQGFGPESLKAILALPIRAIEFGAFGGTNFAKLESLRDPETLELDPLCFVGHTKEEMIDYIHDISKEEIAMDYPEFIISGGVRNYLDGYYYNNLLSYNSVYGQAAGMLLHAQGDYDTLARYVQKQIDGYKFANRYLRLKTRP